MLPKKRRVLFVDRSLGSYYVADALRAQGYTVEVHDDHFAPTEKDTTWLRVAGQKKWIVLSKDPRIRKREIEKQQLRKARVHAFFLGRADLKGPEMAAIFVVAMPRIMQLIEGARGPIVALVRRDGRLDALDANLNIVVAPKKRKKRRPN
ncbi:MAG: hypothetical protein ABI282_11690 [Candidatus Baltobacteraceae bacterium]